MKKIAIPVLFSFVLASLASFTPVNNKSLVNDVLTYTNKFRTSKGMASLEMRADLNDIAQKHSENMARGKVPFSHDGFQKRQVEMKNIITNATEFAENVAYGPTTGEEVVDGWKKSPGHRRNMLGKFKYIGIGAAQSRRGVWYYTQVFVK